MVALPVGHGATLTRVGTVGDRGPGSARLGRLLAGAGNLASVGTAVVEGLSPYCAFDHACLGTTDPDTQLLTSLCQVGDRLEGVGSYLEIEYTQPDAIKFWALGRSRTPVGALVESTGGEPTRSPRYRDILRPQGYADEARVALARDGVLWGILALRRREGRAAFSPEETSVLSHASAPLTEAVLRLAVPTTEDRPQPEDGRPKPDDGTAETGMLVVDDRGRITSVSPRAASLVEQLSSGWPSPPIVDMVVTAARAAPDGQSPEARVRCASGMWLSVSANRLSGPSGHQFVVLLRRSRPAEVAPLLFRASGLTSREIEVAGAVWRQLSTEQIAAELYISGYTVQDHLKSIFAKMGVRSRRELLAKILAEGVLSGSSDRGGVTAAEEV